MKYPLVLLVFLGFCTPGFAQSQDLVIPNGEFTIGGTLLLPEGEVRSGLVIMSSGSGAQDRDENIMNFRIFKIIAEELAASGIPSFRYDDRGVGASTGDFADAALSDLVSDVYTVVEYFRNDAETTFDEFIHLGHSQGGVVGIKAAAGNDHINKLILMAASIVPLKDVINEQIRIIQRSMGKSEEDIAVVLDFQEKVYETVRSDEGWDSLKADYRRLLEFEIGKLPESVQATITDMDAFTEGQFSRQVVPMGNPQMRSLLHYDPRSELAKLDIPVFGIFGGKDTQVTVEQNREAFAEVCKSAQLDCTIRTFSDANHLFQKANSGMVNEYAALPKEFVEGFTADMADWILNN